MLMCKQQLIEFLQEQVPNNAVVEILGKCSEPGPALRRPDHMGRPIDIVLGFEVEDEYEIRVRYIYRS